MEKRQAHNQTEAMAMRTKLLTALTGVALCLALALNPESILAEDENAELQPGVSLRQRIDSNGDGTIDASTEAMPAI